jgi:hypothetical protein
VDRHCVAWIDLRRRRATDRKLRQDGVHRCGSIARCGPWIARQQVYG